MMEKVNIKDKLELINDLWHPRIVGELNDHQLRIVKIKGAFVFHRHENEDEMFFVVKGNLKLEFVENQIELKEGEFIIVPKGVTHRPVAEEEVHLMMFVSAMNVNTGNVTNDFTVDYNNLQKI